MLAWLPPGVEFVPDVEPAAWVRQDLQPWDRSGVRLNSFAPGGFQAYARIFNPEATDPERSAASTRPSGSDGPSWAQSEAWR